MITIKREELKNKVNVVAPKLPEDVVFVAAMRAIKGGQVQIEFAQSRSLTGRRVSVLALLNQGDARFNSGRTLMRTWLMVNEEGFKAVFGDIPDFDFKAAQEAAKTASEDEVVAIFAQAKTINVNGVNHPVKIVCKETTNVEDLPKSIREQIQNPDVSDDIKNRYILQTKDGDKIVDELNNTIYRRYELSYGADDDVLVENKVLQSELAKTASGTVNKTADALKDVLAS